MATSQTLRALEFGLLTWLSSAPAAIMAGITKSMRRRAMLKELNALTDDELDDIGLSRAQINSL